MYGHVVIFAKAPALGTVKTRLAAGIGDVAACALYRNWSRALIRQIGGDARWRTFLAVSPDAQAFQTGSWPNVWPSDMVRLPQGPGDLGARMSRCFRCLPPGPAVIVGSDIPDLECRHVAQAFDRLRVHDAVFGPADDGGYWLIGVSNRCRKCVSLENVRWSTEHALEDTIAALGPDKKIGMLTDQLADIDTKEDLDAWRRNSTAKLG